MDLDIYKRIPHFPVSLNLSSFDANDFREFRARKINSKLKYEVFQNSLFSNSKLYTYFTHVLITYLSRYKKTNPKFLIDSKELMEVLTMLFGFISDTSSDFFKLSLKQIIPSNFYFYYIDFDSSLWKRCKNIKQSCIDFMNKIQLYIEELMNMRFDRIQDFVVQIIDQIREFLEESSDENENEEKNYELITKKILCAAEQIPHFLMSFMDLAPSERFFTREQQQKSHLVFLKGAGIIRKLCI